ncbi:CDP-diacylglycerol--glycerol-3-phosphate 3-phosphatidyltransferase [Bacillus cereus]|uniref:CDP-diacylglycerol--glycerol-3-phosphate 3-phosphatidyltransferase n=2 Tax=Bacillus cereus group TaxID=86661 RepID=A0A9X6XUZ7_BACCE|nr:MULTISPECIES: CDP-diacylglycerol--glycerol-3-phosphate 3-phosphatidyltransferase [Bacillus cereus group]PDZ94295.1 CDP-diacylglycerol--glycerol-3-phosphate 3-phosphatidyltransferase [Bacillus cereus]PFJ27472.1 CDP-diacylglycerol--glycerol-3-phosphate 3-phosphatidyltransferase [Bacillus thuringiensis]PGP11957.1 CDP-diacylglycerol--glycerol-3-phosphate 3-phosphatidyltransferase [Bacillus cereus]
MSLPNKISILRIFLIPLFLFFLLSPFDLGSIWIFKTNTLLALLVFGIASLTDWLDGYLARKLNLVTNFGKFLDPLADKLLMTGGFVALVDLDLAPAWIVILILSRELAITGFRVIAASEGVVIAAGFSGKLKTVIQIITIITLILNLHPLLNQITLWTSAIITIYSGIEYFVQNKGVLQTKERDIK